MNNAVAYCRVSTNEQADHGVSLEAQIAAVKAYAALKGLVLVDVIVDAGVSGGKALADRDGGARLLDLVKRRKVSAVIGTKLDRIFRNTADCLTTTKAWDDANVSLHLIDLGGASLDTSSPMGRLMLTVVAGLGECERNLIAERTIVALKHKKSKGQRVSRFAPIGFRFQDGMVVEDESEQEAVKKIRTLSAAGYGSTKIANILNRQGVKARGRAWYSQSVLNVLAA
jgi:DNA invertase Pin-like site-specific DNA recombinase